VLSGSDLTALVAQRRRLADQGFGLLAAAVVFGVVALSGHYRVFTGLVALVSLAGAAFMSYLYVAAGDGIRRGADELILQRYPYDQRDDRVSGLVAKRARSIGTPAYRRRLATGLRRRVDAGERGAGIQIASHTAITLAGRRPLVDDIADRVENGMGDTVTLVRVDRLLRAPNLTEDMTQDAEADALAAELQRIAAALVS
jgi:hypothetical protein